VEASPALELYRQSQDSLLTEGPTCSLPLGRVHGIKRTYLAPRIHGLFITKTQFRLSTTVHSTFRQLQAIIMYMHIDRQHNYGAIPLLFASLFWFPFAPLPFPFSYLETLLDVIGSRPPWSQVARKLISPSPSPPHSKIPTPWGFPELNVRLTKTTSRIWLTRSRTLQLSFLWGHLTTTALFKSLLSLTPPTLHLLQVEPSLPTLGNWNKYRFQNFQSPETNSPAFQTPPICNVE
jgi:hypothetical protein